MENVLNKDIREVIDKYPEVGRILEEYSIGCAPCSVGSCLVSDVVGIHGLDPQAEATLLYRVEKAIYPDRDIPEPKVDMSKVQAPKEINYSPAVKNLVDEHVLIKRLLALVPTITDFVEKSETVDKELILNCVDFIRGYADKFHHMKEEDILFKYVDEQSEIIKIMYRRPRYRTKPCQAGCRGRGKWKQGTDQRTSEWIQGFADSAYKKGR